ncbi:MAG: hypothetical protein WKF59_20965 [Chitinophagaceae bacterium]
MLFLTRYVSLSSILAGVALPICVLWIYNEKEVFYRVFAVAVAGLNCTYTSKKYQQDI